MNNENESQNLPKRANAFQNLKVKVHINLNDRGWKRGFIIEVGSEFLILDETLEGVQPIFFSDIRTIEKFNPRREVIK